MNVSLTSSYVVQCDYLQAKFGYLKTRLLRRRYFLTWLQTNTRNWFASSPFKFVSSNFRNRIWQPAVKAAGLEGLQIKDMRKTAATNLLQSGADSKTVTAILGHEDIRTTLNHYAKTTPESLSIAANALVAGVEVTISEDQSVSMS